MPKVLSYEGKHYYIKQGFQKQYMLVFLLSSNLSDPCRQAIF